MKLFLLFTATAAATLATAQQHSFSCPSDFLGNFNKTIDERAYVYRVFCDGNIVGTDLRRFSTGNFDACVQACAEAGEACKGASWVSMTNGCILKQDIQEENAYAPGVSTAILQCVEDA